MKPVTTNKIMNTPKTDDGTLLMSPDLLSLSRDVEEKAKKLLGHAMEFRDDWRKGDFDLPNLAKCDMESMEAQFEPLWDALKAIATHRLKTPQNLCDNA
jgi:hypothetical protein